jgi:hypothetical protein
MPSAAQGTSAKAAKAFVRYWVSLLNYAGATGDSGGLKAASASKCSECHAVIDTIEKVHAAGGYFKGDGWSVRTLKYQPFQPRRKPVLIVGVHIAAQQVAQTASAKPRKFKGGNRSMIFRLAHHDGTWVLLALEQAHE